MALTRRSAFEAQTLVAPDEDEVRSLWEHTQQASHTFLRRNPSRTYFLQPMMEKAEAVFYAFVDAPVSILEIGCGDGNDSYALARGGHKVIGIDLAVNRLRRAVRNLGPGLPSQPSFLEANAENLPFSSNQFDVIYSNSVLLYMDKDSALRECHRVLRPGGKVFFAGESMANHPLVRITRQAIRVRAKREKERVVQRVDPFAIARRHRDLYSDITHWEFFLIAPFVLAAWKLLHQGRLVSRKPHMIECRRSHRIDEILLRRFPFLKRYCWLTLIECTK